MQILWRSLWGHSLLRFWQTRRNAQHCALCGNTRSQSKLKASRKDFHYCKPASSVPQRRESRMAFKKRTRARTVLLQIAVIAVVFLSQWSDDLQTHDKVVLPALETRKEQTEDKAYCEPNKLEEAQNHSNKHCISCPKNADCMGKKMVCKPGFKYNNSKSPLHLEKTYAESCEEDMEAKTKAANILEVIIKLLKERRGRYECGLSLEPLFSPSYQSDSKPWSTIIKDMCNGPGITRWQMHFHKTIAPVIADAGVYFWLFDYFLTPDAAAALEIQVRTAFSCNRVRQSMPGSFTCTSLFSAAKSCLPSWQSYVRHNACQTSVDCWLFSGCAPRKKIRWKSAIFLCLWQIR